MRDDLLVGKLPITLARLWCQPGMVGDPRGHVLANGNLVGRDSSAGVHFSQHAGQLALRILLRALDRDVAGFALAGLRVALALELEPPATRAAPCDIASHVWDP